MILTLALEIKGRGGFLMSTKKRNPVIWIGLIVVIGAVGAFLVVSCQSPSDDADTSENSSETSTSTGNDSNTDAEPAADIILGDSDAGFNLLATRGCIACHSIDGTRIIGPSFAGLFGSEVTLEDGTVIIADQDYFVESIREPKAKIVEGFTDTMGAYSEAMISNEELGSIIAYLRTLAE
jgi:cytochrome c2